MFHNPVVKRLILLAAALSGFAQEPRAPKLPDHVAVRPVVKVKTGEEFRAGTAVLARVKAGDPLMLFTALHIFGPDGGLPKLIPSERLDEAVAKVTAESLDGKTVVGAFAGSRIKTGYPMSAVQDCSGDVAAFAVEGECAAKGVLLSMVENKVGDPLWLVGDVAANPAPSQKRWRMTVTAVTPLGLVLSTRERFNLKAFSGAPLINARGTLSGLLIGSDEQEIGPKTKIYAIGSELITKRLSEFK